MEGAKGFGKTRLVMAFVGGEASVVVLDPTNRPDEWPAFGLQHGFVITDDPEDIRRHAKVIVRVNQLWLEDRAGWRRPGTPGWNWTKCMAYIFERGNTYVVFEEAIQTLPAMGPHPGARRILTQGRGNDLRSFVMLQGMIGVDTMSARLAEHFIAFRTAHAGDLQAIYDNRRVDPRPLTQLAHLERGKLIPGAGGSREQFAYHRLGSSEWLLCLPLTEFFVGSKRTTSLRDRDLDAGPKAGTASSL